MSKDEMIKLAKIIENKGYDYETMKYSDYLYGMEEYADDVYDYVIECRDIGRTAFYTKYPD